MGNQRKVNRYIQNPILNRQLNFQVGFNLESTSSREGYEIKNSPRILGTVSSYFALVKANLSLPMR